MFQRLPNPEKGNLLNLVRNRLLGIGQSSLCPSIRQRTLKVPKPNPKPKHHHLVSRTHTPLILSQQTKAVKVTLAINRMNKNKMTKNNKEPKSNLRPRHRKLVPR